ncbi:gamma-taxilin [Aricia agestis]|uniref:gamma-taxilin n=1 Tax=Aricia agestis TaxID=91739 RepID=UPI001C206DEB|nr:gamma-taxilin [Aricia agestis]
MEVETDAAPKEIPNSTPAPENVTEEKSPMPQPQEAPKKKNDKSKRDDKNLDQFMKSLNSIPNPDEKLSHVCKKYVQATDDNKKLQFYIKQSDKRYALLLKEKEQLQHEYNKTVLVKSKLENLCRELQKQNKSIKDESLAKIREEEERRKETQAKFQNTLTEITALLQQNNEKNAKLREDNITITEKFKSVVQQYQLREQQVDKMAKQMNLESQLSDAKMQKAALEHQADRERLNAEMEQMKVTLAQYRAKIMEQQTMETSLRNQLALYTAKYDEFQSVLSKSNQVFGKSKEQIDQMSKKILKLEKESLSWKKRWESSQTALLEMCTERQTTGRRLLSLQGLCRTLQAERSTLLSTLREHNIERPPLPPPQPVEEKPESMAATCETLHQSITHLQNEIDAFKNQAQKEEEPKQKPKKAKSKKNKPERAQKERSVEPKPSHLEIALGAADPEIPELEKSEPEEKVDTETLQNIIQAISKANISIDLDAGKENAKPNGNVVITEINDTEEDVEATKNTTEVSSESQSTGKVEAKGTEIKSTEEINSEAKDNTAVENETAVEKEIASES